MKPIVNIDIRSEFAKVKKKIFMNITTRVSDDYKIDFKVLKTYIKTLEVTKTNC